MPSELKLAGGEWTAVLVPEVGGSLARLDWRGAPVLRPAAGGQVLDMASFPLVPFSNRIAGSRFVFAGREVRMTPAGPLAEHEPAIHGMGWIAPWEVQQISADFAALAFEYSGGEWPWPFIARQTVALGEAVVLTLSIENRSSEIMPAGLGFHPYFPRNSETSLKARHRGEWQTDARTLPTELVKHAEARDWWEGQPVAHKVADTAFTGRDGVLRINWPDRNLQVELTPSPDLDTTVIYTPANADFFCVEPVSHATDAINRTEGMQVLAPGEVWEVSLRFAARRLG